MARLGRSQPNRPIIVRPEGVLGIPPPSTLRAANPTLVHLAQPHRAYRRRANNALLTRSFVEPPPPPTFFLPNYGPFATTWWTGRLTS